MEPLTQQVVEMKAEPVKNFTESSPVMSEETLLSAARRVVRFFNIDMNGGGLITVETQHAVETLDKMVRIEAKKEQNDKPSESPVE